MPTLSKFPPSSLRPDLSTPTLTSNRNSEKRPYLVTGSYRRAEINSSRGTERILVRQQSIALFPHESEDARLTGSTRSLFRRLLALNLPTGSVYSETMISAEITASAKDKKIIA
jgi:hypothetical protein